jgi:hypothetical protein
MDFENKLRPDDWAAPRDMVWDGRAMRYAVASLPGLADVLFAAGDPDAALRLRDFVKAFRVPADAEAFETAKPVKVARVDTDAELVAPLARSHASDREPSPYWWNKEDGE